MEMIQEILMIAVVAYLGFKMKKSNKKSKERVRELLRIAILQSEKLSQMNVDYTQGKQSLLEPDSDNSEVSKAKTV